MTLLNSRAKKKFITSLLAAPIFIFAGCGDQYSKKSLLLPQNYKTIDCAGGIETINAKRVSPSISINNDENVVISGWAVLNTNEGITFDKVQVSITESQGSIVRYSTFKTKREDVSSYFKQGLDDSGFTTFIQPIAKKGIIDIGIFGIKGEQYYLCKNIHQQISIK